MNSTRATFSAALPQKIKTTGRPHRLRKALWIAAGLAGCYAIAGTRNPQQQTVAPAQAAAARPSPIGATITLASQTEAPDYDGTDWSDIKLRKNTVGCTGYFALREAYERIAAGLSSLPSGCGVLGSVIVRRVENGTIMKVAYRGRFYWIYDIGIDRFWQQKRLDLEKAERSGVGVDQARADLKAATRDEVR